MIGKYKNKKDLIIGLSFYIGGSIFGPLIFFVAGGFLIDKYNDTKPLYTLIGLGIAFIVTNVILFKKARGIYKNMVDVEEGKNDSLNIKQAPQGSTFPVAISSSRSDLFPPADDIKENK